ncbi:asparaginase domain-containing protein [Thiothrix lacustris]|uniref:asparaginase domain-containing protein n=1 Tax=Thiothrix lacustris TaxID=525917 RepID=UPI00048A7766|nr:asparaginase domain-containing protein [Thiothrix lacustris]
MQIQLFITGGTLDKVYNPLTGELVFDQTSIPAMLARGRCTLDIAVETLSLKDSLEMNDQDRANILQRCQRCPATHIIITHGTDTMAATAEVLGKHISSKTIVLSGAMIPYTVSHSDALFNLGCAVTGVQLLPAGVYIAMNGQIFSWENVMKNRDAGIFQQHATNSVY